MNKLILYVVWARVTIKTGHTDNQSCQASIYITSLKPWLTGPTMLNLFNSNHFQKHTDNKQTCGFYPIRPYHPDPIRIHHFQRFGDFARGQIGVAKYQGQTLFSLAP